MDVERLEIDLQCEATKVFVKEVKQHIGKVAANVRMSATRLGNEELKARSGDRFLRTRTNHD